MKKTQQRKFTELEDLKIKSIYKLKGKELTVGLKKLANELDRKVSSLYYRFNYMTINTAKKKVTYDNKKVLINATSNSAKPTVLKTVSVNPLNIPSYAKVTIGDVTIEIPSSSCTVNGNLIEW
jgi:hypothetical protein